MNIAVVGLGLIGGSFCKAISAYTQHHCWGIEQDQATVAKALADGAICKAITVDQLKEADLTIVCLHPQKTIDFLLTNSPLFAPGSIVIDVCGVKEQIIQAVEPVLTGAGVIFIGCHPMAGREFSGYDYALSQLFQEASFIMTPKEETPAPAVHLVAELAKGLGFGQIVQTTPKIHDQTIAFTSQLAHVVSNGYIKSPTLENQSGFSAGSFLDLTRVAKLNEEMWTELFMLNKEALLFEVETLLLQLDQYRLALSQEDAPMMKRLLRAGRELKERQLAQLQSSTNK